MLDQGSAYPCLALGSGGPLHLFTMCCKNLGLAASLKDEFNKPWISGCVVSLCLFGVVEELGGSVFESDNWCI